MSAEGVFKTSVFGGFDKQSVLTYVDDLISQQQEKENELQKQAEEAAGQCDDLRIQAAQLTARISELEEEIEKGNRARAELEAENARVAELEEALLREREHSAQLEEQLEQEKEHVGQLEQQIRENDECVQKYEEVVSQVGLVMVEAQNQADVILSRARRQADTIAQEAMGHLCGLSQRVDDMQTNVGQARAFAARTLDEVDRRFADLEEALREAQGHLYISAGITAQMAQTEEPEEEIPAEEPRTASGENGDFFEPTGSRWND